MIVMAFDVATTTGVAWGAAGDTPRFATLDFGKGLSHAERFATAQDYASQMIQTHAPDVVVCEDKIGGTAAHPFPGQALACVMGEICRLGIPVELMTVASIRKGFLGKHLTSKDFPGLNKHQSRKEIKRIVMKNCEMRGWTVANDDEADAGALWEAFCARRRFSQASPIQHGGLFCG